ncbi:MAG: hypothetical protein ACI4AK_02375 [Lepagella sp.]
MKVNIHTKPIWQEGIILLWKDNKQSTMNIATTSIKERDKYFPTLRSIKATKKINSAKLQNKVANHNKNRIQKNAAIGVAPVAAFDSLPFSIG